jgi:hypothetical protein
MTGEKAAFNSSIADVAPNFLITDPPIKDSRAVTTRDVMNEHYSICDAWNLPK